MVPMATILLLHSALGRRPGVVQLSERLAAHGHEVITPDFYAGHVFDDESAGVAFRDEVGARALFERVTRLTEDVPGDAALMGLSLGAAFAQKLAETRRQTSGVVLLHHASRPRGAWPGQPVQVHRYAEDPWIEPADVAHLGEAVRASGAAFEDLVTPGAGHLFTDPGQAEYDEPATARTVEAVDRLLRDAGIRSGT